MGISGAPFVHYSLRKSSKHSNMGEGSSGVAQNISRIKKSIKKELEKSGEVGIGAAAKIVGNSVEVTAHLKSARKTDYFIEIFLVEDNIYEGQANSTYLSNEYNMHIHNSVIRTRCNETEMNPYFYGYPLGEIDQGESVIKEFNIALDESWVVENCRVVIYVTSADEDDPYSYYVKNSTELYLGSSVEIAYR